MAEGSTPEPKPGGRLGTALQVGTPGAFGPGVAVMLDKLTPAFELSWEETLVVGASISSIAAAAVVAIKWLATGRRKPEEKPE